jgi:2Fe-2S ferredoxin
MGTITFIAADGERYEVEADAGITVMQAATSQGIPGIDAECGGSLACATCHVYVEPAWLERLNPPGDTERQMLAFAHEPNDTSRLSCQIRFTDALDGLAVHIPASQ